MDIVTKKKLNILIQLAHADKHFAKSERDLILRIAASSGFSEANVNDLIKNPESIGSLGALSLTQKLDYLLASVELIYADEQVLESEVIFLKDIAIKLGFNKNVANYLVENYQKVNAEELKTKAMSEFLIA